MSDKKNADPLPKNATEAQGLLIKAFHEQCGPASLPVIDDILGRQGRALGLKAKSKLPDNRLSGVAAAFTKNFDPATVTVVSLSDEKFHIQGTKCPFGLENTSRELCEAVMAIDREYFSAATDGRTTLKILQTRATGGLICDTVYSAKATDSAE
ncbi:MAG: L-2-amino-thiazoline-4-carboxylic acid hydrolase [Deltaproteobacteria bacterium]